MFAEAFEVENPDWLSHETALDLSEAQWPDLALKLKGQAEREQNLLLMTRVLLLLGRHYVARSQYLEAVNVLEAGLSHRHLLSTEERKYFLLYLDKSYFALNRFEPLIAQSSELLMLAAETAEPKYQIEVHVLLGSLNVVLGVLDNALVHFDRGLEIANAAEIPPPANLLYGLGRFYYAKNDSTNALYYYEDALKQLATAPNQNLEGAILNNLGILYGNKCQFDQSTQYYLQALNVSRSADDAWNMMLQCNNLGVDLMDRKRFCSARRFFRLALKYLEKTPSASREALIKGNLGELAQLTGELDTAQQLLHESLVLAEQSRDSRRIQERYEDLAKFYEHIGDYENALKHYKLFHQHNLEFVESSASVRATLLQNKFELEKLRQEQEIHRLKNIELTAAMRQFEQLSQRDGLTGLYNRRFFDARLEKFLSEQQIAQPFCIMLADIDNFKKINDTYSHVIGDEVLKIVGDIFANSLRASDIVARYGGEEFAVLLPEKNLTHVWGVCERIRQKIEHYPWGDLAAALKVTISIGLADNATHAGQSIVSAADAQLYLAKRSGKNRVAY